MFDIQTEGLSLTLTPTSRHMEGQGGPYLDRIELEVGVEASGFAGTTEWQVMPGELEKFRSELEQMYNRPQTQGTATLCSAEPGLMLHLQGVGLGNILGNFEVQSQPPDGPKLSGSFGLDQTYLPAMLKGLDTLLAFR